MVFCFVLALNYGEQLKNVYANVNKGDLSWIKIMIASFILLTAWDVALLNIKLFELWGHNFDLDLLNIVGLSSYYLNFLMLNILIFFKFTTFASVAKVDELVEQEVVTESQPELSDSEREMLNRLKRVMEADKFYITPDITLDMLAEQVGIPAKKLSHSIRQQYHLNFYEFINNYRIAEAKRLLSDPQQALKSITEIYFAVGFNSKSVFNTFFKRVEGVTPSQYREKVLDAKVS
jgi:AraC-like DNA-binding protein